MPDLEIESGGEFVILTNWSLWESIQLEDFPKWLHDTLLSKGYVIEPDWDFTFASGAHNTLQRGCRVSLGRRDYTCCHKTHEYVWGFKSGPETGTWVKDMFQYSLDLKIWPQLEGAYILSPVWRKGVSGARAPTHPCFHPFAPLPVSRWGWCFCPR